MGKTNKRNDMLKKILATFSVVLGCACGTSLSAQQMTGHDARAQSGIQWHTDYNQALQAAQQQQKPIVLFFTGSDWCGWCKKLNQEVFNSPEFAAKAGGKFIFVDVDFPMNKQLSQQVVQQNAMLKQKYNVTGYPTVVVLDANQNVLEVGGYREGGGASYANYLMQFAQK